MTCCNGFGRSACRRSGSLEVWACTTERRPALCSTQNIFASLHEPLSIDVGEKSGQVRPYVRPIARRMPLAIMGVRLRVRHQSAGRARSTTLRSVLPELP